MPNTMLKHPDDIAHWRYLEYFDRVCQEHPDDASAALDRKMESSDWFMNLNRRADQPK